LPRKRCNGSRCSTPSRIASAVCRRRIGLRCGKITRPLIEDFKPWLEARLLEVSKKSALGKAIRYTLNHWDGQTRFIDDGRIEIDSNTVERSIKPMGLKRRTICSPAVKAAPRHGPFSRRSFNTAKLQDDPRHYLKVATPSGASNNFYARHEIVDVRHMRKHIIACDQIRGPALTGRYRWSACFQTERPRAPRAGHLFFLFVGGKTQRRNETLERMDSSRLRLRYY
jgi:hypothetical protein